MIKEAINLNKTKKIQIGDRFIGGGNPVLIQSMTNTDTRDIKATINQIIKLQEAGCDIVRVAVVDNEACEAIKEIKKHIKLPLVADIHFDYRLAIASIENGADKIRINPGNIGDEDRVKLVVAKSKEYNIPIRIGVNSGSLQKDILKKYDGVTAKGLVESALLNAEILEKYLFDNIVFSLKASNVMLTIESYREIAKVSNYPLHVGITESGTYKSGTIKSSVGIGAILASGVGDTIRVSLTGDPVREIEVAREILKSLDMISGMPELISCPTCGRCRIDLTSIADEVEEKIVRKLKKDIKIAIMGCAVNGPGEAKEADIGIAGGDNEALLFKKGKIIRKIKAEKIIDELIKEIEGL